MADLLTKLIPTALVGAINVVPITVVVTLLMARGGLARAVAFGIGQSGALAAIGGIALATASTNAGSTDTGSAVTGTIIAVVGGLLLILALKQLLGAPDPDAPPPTYMAKLESMSVSGALVMGLVLGLVNVKQLGIYAAGIAETKVDIVVPIDIAYMGAAGVIDIDWEAAGPAPHPVRGASIEEVLLALFPGFRRARMPLQEAILLTLNQPIQLKCRVGGRHNSIQAVLRSQYSSSA